MKIRTLIFLILNPTYAPFRAPGTKQRVYRSLKCFEYKHEIKTLLMKMLPPLWATSHFCATLLQG